jgi:hypothetical protein
MRELLDYRTLHWGTQPTGVENLAILDPSVPMIAVCELKACSYITVKAGKPEVYRHAFPKHDGRGPYLLKAKEPGDQEGEIKGTFFPPIPAKSGDSNSMGRLIDFVRLRPLFTGWRRRRRSLFSRIHENVKKVALFFWQIAFRHCMLSSTAVTGVFCSRIFWNMESSGDVLRKALISDYPSSNSLVRLSWGRYEVGTITRNQPRAIVQPRERF